MSHKRAANSCWTGMALLMCGALTLHAQPSPQPPVGGGRGAAPPQRREDYPRRAPADAASVERGKALYGVNCQFCHGADTRGGDSGPSLLHAEVHVHG